MIRVYAADDCHARAITFGDETPEPPLELVRAFGAGEREAAWALLHQLGRIWATGRPRSRPRASQARSPREDGSVRPLVAPV